MKEKRGKSKEFKIFLIIAIIIVVLVLAWFVGKNYIFKKSSSDFEIDNVLLKIALKKDGSITNNIKITNINEKTENFNVKVNYLDDFVSLDASKFELNAEESKNLQVIFENTKNKMPGVYLGSLKVSSDAYSKEIPVILEVESGDVLFDSNINIFSTSGNIIPGEKINGEIKIYDLVGSGTTNVEMTYFIKDFSDKTIISETENIVIKDTASVTKTIELPASLEPGDYALGVIISYGNSFGTSTNYFKVKSKAESEGFLGLGNNFLVIIIILGFFFLVLLFLFYFMISRDKLFLELNRQYKYELRKQRTLLSQKEKESYVKLKTKPEKTEYEKEFKKVKEKRFKAIKEIHEKRVKEFKKIKRTKKKDVLKKQIEAWKKQGYDTRVLESRFKAPDVNDIKKKIKEWKKKGYDTRVLEK